MIQLRGVAFVVAAFTSTPYSAAAQIPFIDRMSGARIEQLIKQGGPAELYNEAVRLENGHEGPEDPEAAAKLYERAAELGSIEAANNLGYLYEQGIGVERDIGRAFDLYKVAAKRNYALAVYNLGIFYLKGKGVKQDIKEGERLLLQARAMGVEQAEYYLKRLDRFVPVPEAKVEKKVNPGVAAVKPVATRGADVSAPVISTAPLSAPLQTAPVDVRPSVVVKQKAESPRDLVKAEKGAVDDIAPSAATVLYRNLNVALNPNAEGFSLYRAESLLEEVRAVDPARYQEKNKVYTALMANRCRRVITRGANVRGGPDIKHPVIGWLKEGDHVCLLAGIDGWSKVNIFHKTPHVGWVSNTVLPK